MNLFFLSVLLPFLWLIVRATELPGGSPDAQPLQPDSTPNPEAAPAQQTGSSEIPGIFRSDEWAKGVESKLDAIAASITGGFTDTWNKLTPPQSPAPAEEPASSSETPPAEVQLQTEDRPPLQNRRHRVRFQWGNLLK